MVIQIKLVYTVKLFKMDIIFHTITWAICDPVHYKGRRKKQYRDKMVVSDAYNCPVYCS